MQTSAGTIAVICFGAVAVCAEPLLLQSFEDERITDRLRLKSARVSRTKEHATDGGHALKIDYSVDKWPHVLLEAESCYSSKDWSGHGRFVFDVYNPEDAPVRLSVRIDDLPQANGRVHCRQTSAEIPPQKQVTVSMAVRRRDVHMRGVPKVGPGDVNADLGSRELDLTNIIAFQFFLGRPENDHTVYIDNIRLMQGPILKDIVDHFGQYTGDDWPGKVHEEADLTGRAKQEAKQLNDAPTPENRDKWGGWTGGPRLKATGWFRTEKLDGKWWLVTPDGHLFWSVGVDCVKPQSWGPFRGRQYMFTWLPEKGNPLYRFGGKGKNGVDFYRINLYRKYGSDWLDDWLDVTRRRMKTWGFNTVGNWSDDRACDRLNIPFVVPIHYGGVPSFDAGWKTMPDIYNDKWQKHVRGAIKETTAKWRDDPYCIGYFVDNELPWGGWGGKGEFRLVKKALALDDDRAIKQQFTRLLADKYKNIAALNDAWNTSIPSWDAFRAESVSLPENWTNSLCDDMSMLLAHTAERYFSTVSGLMEEYAPNQLYLGSRFAVCPDDAVFAAAKYCDVVSYNIYGRSHRILDRGKQAAKLDMPVIIGEFHFGATDRGMFHTGLGPVKSQKQRGVQYAKYIRTALNQPWCVGAHWFRYPDQSLTGRFDGENYNIGLVSITDTPYPELLEDAKEVNFGAYHIRAGGASEQ